MIEDIPDLSGEDEITLAGITVRADRIGPDVRHSLRVATSRIMAEHGPRAFEMPKRAAAVHEAGHCVVHRVLGGRVKSVQIRRPSPMIWAGYTAYPRNEHLVVPHQHTREQHIRTARELYSGVAAEMLFDAADFRAGSSLDEIIMSQIFAGFAAKVGEDGMMLWQQEVHDWCGEILRQHRVEHAAITEALLKRHRLRGREISALAVAA